MLSWTINIPVVYHIYIDYNECSWRLDRAKHIVYDGNVGFDDNLLGVEISIHIYTISPDNPSIVYIHHPATLHLTEFSQRRCLAILPPLQGLAGSSKATSRKRTGAALPLGLGLTVNRRIGLLMFDCLRSLILWRFQHCSIGRHLGDNPNLVFPSLPERQSTIGQ